MRRTPVVIGAWLAGTAAAVVVSLSAVNFVAARVTDPLPPALPASQSGSATTVADPAPAPTPTASVSRDDRGAPTPDPTADRAPDDDRTEDRHDDDLTARPTPRTTPSPGDTPSPAARGEETRTVHTVGGDTAIRFADGATIEVLWATPASGFEVDIEHEADGDVRVDFRSEAHRSRVHAAWEDGEPRIRVEERDE